MNLMQMMHIIIILKFNSSTKYKPLEFRDLEDTIIINIIKNNINYTISKAIIRKKLNSFDNEYFL